MSMLLFLDKHFHRSSAFIYGPILIKLHTNVRYDNILHRLAFEHNRSKVKAKDSCYF